MLWYLATPHSLIEDGILSNYDRLSLQLFFFKGGQPSSYHVINGIPSSQHIEDIRKDNFGLDDGSHQQKEHFTEGTI